MVFPGATMAAFEWGWDTVVALGTLGLAVFTGALAWSTRALAQATRKDHQAQWRPVVVAESDGVVGVTTDSGGRIVLGIDVRNVGRGPAFAVQAQLRSGKRPIGASRSGTMGTLVPGEAFQIEARLTQESDGQLGRARRPSPPSVVDVELAYYDIAERWHHTYLKATRSRGDDVLHIRQTLVEETDRRLLPVHGSRRAMAEADRRERQRWRRSLRAVRDRLRAGRRQE